MPRPPRIDVAVAAVMLAAGVAVALGRREPHAGEIALTVVLCAPLAWRRAAPLAAVVITIAAAGALAVGYPDASSLVVPLAMLLVAVSSGRWLDPPLAYVAIAYLIAVSFAALVLTDGLGTDYVFIGLLFGGFWGFGQALRRRSAHVEVLTEQAQTIEAEAVADERARIARELHDIVSHSITAITLQSQAIQRRLHPDQEAEREDLRSIETTARQAMTEMRRLFGVLRSTLPPDGDALSPQPGLDQLPRLFDTARASGQRLAVEQAGPKVPLPPGLDLAAYRIVQESLTNVRKHSPDAHTRVRLAFSPRALEIDVADDGAGPRGPRANGAGHGLVGIRERVALYGGEVEAGPADGGGFRVRARLPL